jgi:large subunit ribosomal protein L9
MQLAPNLSAMDGKKSHYGSHRNRTIPWSNSLLTPVPDSGSISAQNILRGVISAMQVILREDIDKLGKIGDLVKVADGYARNFLVPNKKAIQATPDNLNAMNHAKKMVSDRVRKIKKEATGEADRIRGLVVVIKAKTGEEGKLFGSVTSMDIVDAAKAQGVEIDKRKIVLDEPIKRLGDHTVSVKLHADIVAEFKVSVIAEE